MTDEWSLKNKGIKTWQTDNPKNEWLTYKESDIEILRQRLIEDIDTLDCTDKSKLKKWEIIEEVLEIIDKRFGVEK